MIFSSRLEALFCCHPNTTACRAAYTRYVLLHCDGVAWLVSRPTKDLYHYKYGWIAGYYNTSDRVVPYAKFDNSSWSNYCWYYESH